MLYVIKDLFFREPCNVTPNGYKNTFLSFLKTYEKENILFFAAPNLQAYNLEWLHGFTYGDGSFHFILRQQSDYRYGYQVQAVFDLSQKVSSQEWLCVAIHILGKDTRYTLAHTQDTNHLRVVRRDLCP